MKSLALMSFDNLYLVALIKDSDEIHEYVVCSNYVQTLPFGDQWDYGHYFMSSDLTGAVNYFNRRSIISDEFIRGNWEIALSTVAKGSDLSEIIDYGLSWNDLHKLAELHQNNTYRDKIEDLLTDCNYHYECSRFKLNDYDEYMYLEH